MKPYGSSIGGRIIIIDSSKTKFIAIKNFLEKAIALISTVPSVSNVNYIDSANINEFVATTLKNTEQLILSKFHFNAELFDSNNEGIV